MFLSSRLVASCALAVLATGCVSLIAPPYSANYTALDQLRLSRPEPAAVAAVQPEDPKHAVNNLSLRGSPLRSGNGTFAKYLEDALIGDLKEISVYDANSQTRIAASILRNEMNVGDIATGNGLMEVEFTVTRNDARRLRKTYSARTTFESSFAGAVAIPKGQIEYPNLVRSLLREVYTDPAFVAALAK